MLERSASPMSPCPLRVTGQVAALEEMLTTEHEEAAALQQLLELRRQLKGARASRREAGARLLAVSTAKDLEVGAVCSMRPPSWRRHSPPPRPPPTAPAMSRTGASRTLVCLERRALVAQAATRM